MRELDILVRLFEAAAELVEKELLRATARDAKLTARIKRERLTLIAAVLERLRSEVMGADKSPGAAWRLIEAAYREGSKRASNDVGRVGAKPGPAKLDTTLTGIHLRVAKELYASLTDDLDQAILYARKEADRTLRKVTLSEVLVGQIAGRGQAKNADAIEENLRSRGVRGFKESRGREWKLGRYARMAAAQASSEALTTAVLKRAVENGFDLVRISEHAGSCDACKRHEGKVYSITGETPGYDVLEEAPPYHPHCAHFPVIEVEMEGAA